MKDFEGERDQYQSAVLTLTSMMAIVLGCIYFLIPDIWNRIIGVAFCADNFDASNVFLAPAQDFGC